MAKQKGNFHFLFSSPSFMTRMLKNGIRVLLFSLNFMSCFMFISHFYCFLIVFLPTFKDADEIYGSNKSRPIAQCCTLCRRGIFTLHLTIFFRLFFHPIFASPTIFPWIVFVNNSRNVDCKATSTWESQNKKQQYAKV